MRSFLYLFLVGILIYGCSKTEAFEPAAPPAPVAPAPIPEIGELNLELPENNKTCETGTISLDKADVEFKWKAAPNATKYEIQVTDVLDNKTTIYADVTGTS